MSQLQNYIFEFFFKISKGFHTHHIKFKFFMNFNHLKNSFNNDGVFIEISQRSPGIDCRDMYMLWHGSIVYDCIIIHLCKWHECIVCDEGQCFPGPKFISMPNSPSDDSRSLYQPLSFFFIPNNFFPLFVGVFAKFHPREKRRN